MNQALLNAETIIFDIGNVLLTFNPDELSKRLLHKEHREILQPAIFQSGYWQQMDAGLLSSPKAAQLICDHCARPDLEAEVLHLIKNFPRELEVMPAVSLIKPLKEMGKRVFALSNFPGEGFKLTCRLHSFLELMNGFAISAFLRQCKPEPEIYRSLLRKYSIDPSRAVFIDDVPENVRGAENEGITGILYTGFHVLQ